MTSQMNFGPQWMRGGDNIKETRLNNKDHSFKYSKEYMLSLYDKSSDIPVKIEHHEFTVMPQGQSPLSLLDNENKTLAENSMSDYRLQQHIKANDSKDTLKYFDNDRGSEDDIPLWSGVEKDNVGTFDSNGVFRLGETSTSLLEPEQQSNPGSYLFSPDPNGTNKDHRRAMSHPSSFFFKNDLGNTNHQWVYRDPSGNIQGPFSSVEMQDWFEAGYFDPALAVKRVHSSFFEPIAELVRKVKDPKTPFLAPWPDRTPMSLGLLPSFNTEFANTPFIDRISQQNEFNNTMNVSSSTMGTIAPLQSPFGVGLPLVSPPPLRPHDLQTPQSPWERPLSNGLSWLNSSNQNDERVSLSNRTETMIPNFDYQQQMEQQYLHMLRQNQQQHIQLQQQILMQQHQDMLIHTQQPNPMGRGWSSVPGTPGVIEPNLHNLWGNDNSGIIQSRPPPATFKSNIEVEDITTANDHLSETLSNVHIKDIRQKENEQAKDCLVDVEQPQEKDDTNSSVPFKKTLREIQSEQEAAQKNPTRPNTWSSVSAKQGPSTKPVSISPSYSTNTNSTRQSSTTNVWDKSAARQKRMSMTAATVSTPSKQSAIKSEPRGPSEEFIKWCKLSLSGLNSGVNADEILQMLLDFPVDDSCSEIIQDMIYANSTSMDGRRFANDFMIRRKADMDGKKLNLVLPKSTTIISSEFKVVTKKGKKKPSSTAK